MSEQPTGEGERLRRTCGAWEAHLRYLKEDPDYRDRYLEAQKLIATYLRRNADAGLRAGVAQIPVVVHVVYNTADQNISDARVQSQIDALNQDYRKLNTDVSGTPAAFAPVAADARMEFHLAVRDPQCHATTGITRTQTNVMTFDIFNSDDVKSASAGGADPWPSDRYLNIWVCPGQANQLGRGTFPGTAAAVDGLIVVFQAFGDTGSAYPSYASFNLGRTATHEIGHCFDLHHLWGDVSDCSGTDFVADTPNQQAPNYGCRTFPHVTCSNGPNGDMFMNFMDYSDDRCMFMFTAGQVARMEAALVGPRASLLASDGLVPPLFPDIMWLWSADSPQDQGDEPDTVSPALWQSDDIWVRNGNDGIANQEHQNPIYGSTNYVYVRVRNRSCGSAGSGTLKLYWAKASSALGWPAPWDGSVTTPALMGSQIGSQATGTVNGRGSVILTFPWSPPNPDDYASFGADKNHFCLLSRIETSSVAPYGMTYPETGNLSDNVKNNAKIAWKNVEVASSGHRMSAFTVSNFGEGERCYAFAIAVPEGERLDPEEWRILVRADADLTKRLEEAGKVEIDSDGRFVIEKPGELIGSFALRPGEHRTLEVEVQHCGKRAPAAVVIALDAIQYAVEQEQVHALGGQRLVFKLNSHRRWERTDLIGEWLHAHEEDEDGITVWRPATFELPPSRGRRKMNFADDASAVFYEIAPDDALRALDGFWHAEDEGTIVLDFADPDLLRRRLTIAELDVDILRIESH
jgi:pregnancy-associated plasma protein-A